MLLTQHPHRHTTLNGNLISYLAYSSIKNKKKPPFIDKTAAMPFKICLKVEYYENDMENPLYLCRICGFLTILLTTFS